MPYQKLNTGQNKPNDEELFKYRQMEDIDMSHNQRLWSENKTASHMHARTECERGEKGAMARLEGAIDRQMRSRAP